MSSVCREIGRLRGVFESLEEGRCCHDSVPEREGAAGLVLGWAENLGGEGGIDRGFLSWAAGLMTSERIKDRGGGDGDKLVVGVTSWAALES